MLNTYQCVLKFILTGYALYYAFSIQSSHNEIHNEFLWLFQKLSSNLWTNDKDFKKQFLLTNSVINRSEWFVDRPDRFIAKKQNIDSVTCWTSLFLFYSIRAYSGLCFLSQHNYKMCICYRNVHYFQTQK